MTKFDSDLIIFHYDPIKSLKILSKQVLPGNPANLSITILSEICIRLASR